MVFPMTNSGETTVGSSLLSHRAERIDGVKDDQRATEVRALQSYRNVPAYGILQHAADALPERAALIHAQTSWSYRELNEDAVRCAAMLRRLGVRPGDRVGILLPNVPEYVIAINGIWRAGGVALAISPLMVEEEIEGLLEHTECRFLICLDLLKPMIPSAASSSASQRQTLLVSLKDKLPAHQQFGYLLKLGVQRLWERKGESCGNFWAEMAATEVDEISEPKIDTRRDPAFILPTGGTTDRPKAVTLSHENLVANAWQQSVWIERSFGTETMLAVLPYFHSYGMSATLLGSSMLGATSILHHRFNTRQVIRLIEHHRPTVMHAVPAMLAAMNSQLSRRPSDLSSLRWVISGGAPLDEGIAREFADHSGALVVEGYGLSEASPVTHVGHLFREPRYGVIGLPLPETQCRIVSTTDPTTEVPHGSVGELLVRGPQVMLGYWNDPVATATALQDGWLHTGDLARKDNDGYYSIVGRKKDLIITSGFNVHPTDVETAIGRCPGVAAVAVVGDRDRERGEIVHAHVVLEKGEAWDEKKLADYCRKHLAAHKRPRRFTQCFGDLPRNFLGKVLRRHLRESQPNDKETQ